MHSVDRVRKGGRGWLGQPDAYLQRARVPADGESVDVVVHIALAPAGQFCRVHCYGDAALA